MSISTSYQNVLQFHGNDLWTNSMGVAFWSCNICPSHKSTNVFFLLHFPSFGCKIALCWHLYKQFVCFYLHLIIFCWHLCELFEIGPTVSWCPQRSTFVNTFGNWNSVHFHNFQKGKWQNNLLFQQVFKTINYTLNKQKMINKLPVV